MSEQLRTPEQHHKPEVTSEHLDRIKAIHEKAQESRHEHAEKIDTIRAKIDLEATKAEQHHEEPSTNEHQPLHHYITKRIKSEQYKQTLKQVQAHLPKREKQFSKVIHQPTVEAASEIGAKTVARPYGIIGGALFAIIGSFTVLAIARHIGFEVPNSIFFIFFVIGYGASLVIELIVRATRKASPKHRQRQHSTPY